MKMKQLQKLGFSMNQNAADGKTSNTARNTARLIVRVDNTAMNTCFIYKFLTFCTKICQTYIVHYGPTHRFPFRKSISRSKHYIPLSFSFMFRCKKLMVAREFSSSLFADFQIRIILTCQDESQVNVVQYFRQPLTTQGTQLQTMTNLMHKFLIYLLQSSTCTCFEQYLAHPQEVKLYLYSIWHRHSQ